MIFLRNILQKDGWQIFMDIYYFIVNLKLNGLKKRVVKPQQNLEFIHPRGEQKLRRKTIPIIITLPYKDESIWIVSLNCWKFFSNILAHSTIW